MKRLAILTMSLLSLVLLGALVRPAHAENRPAELPLLQSLNGEVTRELNTLACTGWADGGGLTLWTADAGIGCNCVRTGAVYEMHCDVGVNFCPWGDGGCSTVIGSQNYGKPVKASTPSSPAPFYFVVQPGTQGSTKYVCMTQNTQAVAICSLFRLQ